jgi:hypothetical protein
MKKCVKVSDLILDNQYWIETISDLDEKIGGVFLFRYSGPVIYKGVYSSDINEPFALHDF